MAEQPCGSDDKSEFLPGFENVNEFTQKTLRAVLGATKFSNELPAAGDDFDFYSSYPGFQEIMEVEGKRIMHMLQNILKHQHVKINMGTADSMLDIEDKVDLLKDANDQILERVGIWLDEVSGLRKKDCALVVATANPKQTTTASWNKKNNSSGNTTPSYKLLSAKNIQRPQLKFKDKVDNGSRPFYPIIKEKTNALISMEESMKLPEGVTAETIEDADFQFPHPYKYEIDHLTFSPEHMSKTEPQLPGSLEETPLSIVTTLQELDKLVEVLKKQKEIAVDLEHHSFRTFQGITCLMQISTRNHDYLVDTLELRSDLHLLNTVFTDPNIVKVLHGADSDIDWLQRDLGVYVVNMFDTGQAARVMSYSRFSLAHLLQNYCDVTADKQYQLADWRIRPLPEALVNYAREDTHYLLYIYDKMKNELIERGNEQKNLLMSVLNRSKGICVHVYRRLIYRDTDHLELHRKNKKVFNSQQMAALKGLYHWRDHLGRAEDESTGFVLPNHMLLQICTILPRESQGVLACCNPIPPLIRQFLNEIHAIIMQARETPLEKLSTAKERKPSSIQHPKYDVDSLLNCPHDLSHQSSRQDVGTSTLLSDRLSERMETSMDTPLFAKRPVLTALTVERRKEKRATGTQKKVSEIMKSFISPFDQFLPKNEKQKVVTIKQSTDEAGPSQVTWKLVPNTKKRKDGQTDADEPLSKRSKKEEADTTPVEKTDDDMKAIPRDIEIPLRFQMPETKGKKKKKRSRNRDIDMIEKIQKNEDQTDLQRLQNLSTALGSSDFLSRVKSGKMKKGGSDDDDEKGEEQETSGFKPYDYSQSSKVLEANKGQDIEYYDPMAGMMKKKGKSSRSRTRPNKGKKSATWKT